jgi:hypothetical protein
VRAHIFIIKGDEIIKKSEEKEKIGRKIQN